MIDILIIGLQVDSDWKADPVLEDACEEVVTAACDPKVQIRLFHRLYCLCQSIAKRTQKYPLKSSSEFYESRNVRCYGLWYSYTVRFCVNLSLASLLTRQACKSCLYIWAWLFVVFSVLSKTRETVSLRLGRSR